MSYIKRSLLLSSLSLPIVALLSYLLPKIIDDYYAKMELQIPYKTLLPISLILLFSTIFLFVFIITLPYHKTQNENKKPKIKKLKMTRKRKKILENLSDDEKKILSGYIQNNTIYQKLDHSSGTVYNLCTKKILSLSDRSAERLRRYTISHFAWVYLNKNKELFLTEHDVRAQKKYERLGNGISNSLNKQ